MKVKKIVSSMLLIIFLTMQISLIPFNNIAYAETNTKNGFHYEQLVENAKSSDDKKSKMAVKLYDAMYEMYTSGQLKTGTASKELTDNVITQDELSSYVKGDQTLRDGMNAARYAFYADYPEIFYVNFQHLTFRVTSGGNKFHITIGPGKYENYYVEGFENQEQVENAISEFDTIVSNIKTEAETKTSTEEKIKYVHNEIINKVSYKYENECYVTNKGFLGTPYGTLVKRQGVCEGYARAFKTIMDKLGIACILVQGVHQYSGEVAVEHMWNYVKIENSKSRSTSGKWYAVDCTQDDPAKIISEEVDRNDYINNFENYGKDGYESETYLLAGGITMNQRHFEKGIVAAAGDYEFIYPTLEEENLGTIENENDIDGFKVTTEEVTITAGITGNEIINAVKTTISYKGMSIAKAMENGIYVLMKETNSEEEGRWGYLISKYMAFSDSEDGTYSTYINIPAKYTQFAITDKPWIDDGQLGNLIYRGTEDSLIAMSERIYSDKFDSYKAAPYIVKQNPPCTTTIRIRTAPYKVTATWDEELVIEEGKTITPRVVCKTYLGTTTGDGKYAKIENIKLNEDRKTVTFDFTFSGMFSEDLSNYIIYMDGLVGKTSKKPPNSIVLSGNNVKECLTKQMIKGNWNLNAQPMLIDNDDLSNQQWITSDGKEVSDILRNRIALVTTETTSTQDKAMKDKRAEAFPNDEIKTSKTYNISLNLCKKQIKMIKDGHKVTMKVGFPEGYGPESEGVTFKAYHFTKNTDGTLKSVEELDCVVTQYGLIITCDAFSPFEVAVVEGTNTKTKKALITTAEENGKISSSVSGNGKVNGNVITMNEGETATINVIPDEGYMLETLTVCGEKYDLTSARTTSEDTKQITVSYDQIKDENAIVNATFVAKHVAAAESAAGQTVAIQEPDTPTITMPDTQVAGLNGTLTINPVVSNTNAIQTYQWYKGDTKLEGKTGKTLNIENIGTEHAGTYRLEVTTTIDAISKVTQSTNCNVSIANMTIELSKNTGAKLHAGDTVEVTASISSLNNITTGIYAIGGKLIYNTDILELTKMEGLNGWDIKDSYNTTSKKFVIDNSNNMTQGDILKMTFTIKDCDKLTTSTEISMEEIFASDAKIDIGAVDTAINILIDVTEKEPEITSDVYKIEKSEGFITRIKPNTTVTNFKSNITTNTTLEFIKDGNKLSESSVITTNTILKVGDLEFTLVVTGDIDGKTLDGESISLTDLSQLKLHYIESPKVALSPASIKAADINGDGKITITDVAQLKLVLIGSMEIK